MRRPFRFLFPGLFALALVASGLLLTTSMVAAATIAPTTTCSNGVDDTPGLGLICQVSVVNTFTPSGGTAKVTVRECHGAAGDPTAACSVKTTSLTRPVTAVTQCNASTNGGGGTLRCNVWVTNRFSGVSPNATAATVNQCVGSGDGIANNCDPFPATTTGATITQCNGSANGGTLVRLECTATGKSSSAHRVTINQCNGSTNGGGALVICSASVTNVILSAPSSSSSGSSSGLPNTSTADEPVAAPSVGSALVVPGLALLAVLTLVATFRRYGGRRNLR
ncbi:MAG TPA: hypothetical protein VIL81_03810 [Candidatus Limnocylindrales bacterium]